ncbi:MAG: MerR family transcriptional regulator [Nitrospirae bacterium]|nr:MerR family transcriptional regulator [Nitrospirota bacterium]
MKKGRDMPTQLVFSIHEVSQLTGVPSHTIRFWEKGFNVHVRPAKTPGGQRRYCNRDIEIIKIIKRLRYQEKYTIAGAIRELERNSNKRMKDTANAGTADDTQKILRVKAVS